MSGSVRIPVRVTSVSLCKGLGNWDRQSNDCAVRNSGMFRILAEKLHLAANGHQRQVH